MAGVKPNDPSLLTPSDYTKVRMELFERQTDGTYKLRYEAALTFLQIAIDAIRGGASLEYNTLAKIEAIIDALNSLKMNKVATATENAIAIFDSAGNVKEDDGNLAISSDAIKVAKDGNVDHLGNLTEHLAHHASPYISEGAEISDNGDGSITVSEAECWVKIENAIDATFKAVVVPTANLIIPAGENHSIYVKRNIETGEFYFDNDVSVPGAATTNWDWLVFALVQRTSGGTTLNIYNFKDAATNSLYKILLRMGNLRLIEYWFGVQPSTVGTRQIAITSGIFYVLNEQVPFTAFNSSTGDTFTLAFYTGTTWTRTAGQTTIPNTQYNNVATGLVVADNNKFLNFWVYNLVGATSKVYVVYGQNQYADLASAQAAAPLSFLPNELGAFSTALLIAQITVEKGSNILYYKALVRSTLQTTAPVSHDQLAGVQAAGAGVTYGHVNENLFNSIIPPIIANKGVGLSASKPVTGLTIGDIFVSTDSLLKFTATSDTTWDAGVALQVKVFVNDTLANPNKLYQYDGTALNVTGDSLFYGNLGFAMSDEDSDLTTNNKGQREVLRACILESITFYVNTAPTSVPIIVTVYKNDTLIHTITLPVNNTTVTVSNTTSFAVGDRFKAFITQVGSGTIGNGAKIETKSTLL